MIKRILMTSIFGAALILTGCTEHVPAASLVASYSQTDADKQITSTDILSSVTDNDTDYAGVNTPSPIAPMTLEQICEELNLTLSFPMTAQNIQKINGDPTIYEMNFTQEHHTCNFRFAKTDTLEDISSIYYDWTRSTYDPTADQLYTCKFTDEGQGICQWMQDGYSMSLSMETNASEEFFSEMYSLIADNFHPSENTEKTTALSLPFSVNTISSIDMYHYDSVPADAQKKVIDSSADINTLYETLSGLQLKPVTTDDMVGNEVTSFRFHLPDNSTYDIIYCYYGFRKGEISTDNYTYTVTTDLTSFWNTLAPNQEPTPAEVTELSQ